MTIVPLTAQEFFLDARLAQFPTSRYMGSKQAILPFLHNVLSQLPFEVGLDAFSGSAAVSYLLKAMGKTVIANDFLAMAYHTANACVTNEGTYLDLAAVEQLLTPHPSANSFIRDTFSGLYFTEVENELLDHVMARLAELVNPFERSLATAAVVRACLRRRPRGVFTYTGLRYDDGRRDLRISMADHIRRAAAQFNSAVFSTGRPHQAFWGDVFDLPNDVRPDLVYIDPPYVSPHSDNDYTRRYHFVEGFARGWCGVEIQHHTATRKFARKRSRFDSKATIYAAFADLFERFRDSILVVSYSSNSVPSKDEMVALLRRVKREVVVHSHSHRYSFGTHGHKVGDNNNEVAEYLFVGR
jgi:DNA adenine methylase